MKKRKWRVLALAAVVAASVAVTVTAQADVCGDFARAPWHVGLFRSCMAEWWFSLGWDF